MGWTGLDAADFTADDVGSTNRPAGAPTVCILRSSDITHDKRTIQVARTLSQSGMNVEIVCLGGTISDDDVTVRQVRSSGYRSGGSRLIRVMHNTIEELGVRKRMRVAVRRVAPDLVYCMNLDTLYSGWVGSRERPFVYDAREHFPSTGKMTGVRRRWWIAKERFFSRRAAQVLTVSDPIADDLATRYGIDRPVVIYNGTDGRAAQPSPVHSPLRVLYLGKLFSDRRVDDIVRAVVSLGGRATLTIRGWGEQETALRRLVSELNADAVVEFSKPVPPEDIVSVSVEHDVGVFHARPDTDCLRWSAPNKVFEYMSSGLAVLSVDLPAIGKIIRDAGCGDVYAADDPQGLEASLRRLVDDQKRVMQYKHKALVAAEEYGWPHQARKLVAVVVKAMEAGG